MRRTDVGRSPCHFWRSAAMPCGRCVRSRYDADRVPLGRIGRGDVLVDVQGTATRPGADDQPAEGGEPRLLIASTNGSPPTKRSSTEAPGRGIQAAMYTTGSSGCSTAILVAVKPPNE